jgi:pimeloyl-ACP methyl ester carboxylesterase
MEFPMATTLRSAETVLDIGLRTEGIWCGPGGRRLAGWLTCRPGVTPVSAVVIAPPTGYAYWCSHRSLRLLAERLAAAGHGVLRIDYDGTGDSAGDQWDPDRVQAWRDSLAHGVQEMRDRGAEQVTLFGARLGGTIALLDAHALGADRVVAWLPFSHGRRYSKEVRLLSRVVPPELEPSRRSGTRVLAGCVFSDDTIREIAGLTLADLDGPPAREVLVIDDPAASAADAAQQLRELGTMVEHMIAAEAEDALETPPESAEPPHRLLDRVAEWIGPAPSAPAPVPAASRAPGAATIAWRGGNVRERFLRLGPEAHAAVMTEPIGEAPEATVLVLLNPGSEPHVGPGRAWVEYARDLALAGRRTVRVDLLGWGESPDAGDRPGRPYDGAGIADALAIVRALREAGHPRVALGGLCASAWIALAAARRGEVDGVIAINPQLYWQPGDPVEIDWDLIRSRRIAEIRRIEYGARTHLWDLMDTANLRGRVGRWLDELAGGRTRAELVFAEGDDGLDFLKRRHGRRLARLRRTDRIGVQEVAGIDHPMYLTWLRPGMTAALERALERIDDGAGVRPALRRGRGPTEVVTTSASAQPL